MSLEIILATILIANPDPDAPKPLVEALAQSLLTLMVSGEIVNGRDLAYYTESVRQGRWDHVAQLCRDTERLPRVDESPFRVSHWQLLEDLKANRRYRQYLVARWEMDAFHADVLMDAIGETDWLYFVYELAATAADVESPIGRRRQALADLRDAIGAEAYYSGRLPAAVPVRHLTRTDSKIEAW